MMCGFPTRGHDASQITLALGTAASYPRACQALGAMLSRGALNPADITVLFKMFTSMDPPPVELVSCLGFSKATCPTADVGWFGGASKFPSFSQGHACWSLLKYFLLMLLGLTLWPRLVSDRASCPAPASLRAGGLQARPHLA